MTLSERGSIHKRIWVETRTHLGRDTNASGTRHERIWYEAHLCLLPRSPTSRKQQDGSSMGNETIQTVWIQSSFHMSQAIV